MANDERRLSLFATTIGASYLLSQEANTLDAHTPKMEAIDQLASRVTAIAAFGGMAGTGIALFKGHRLGRTAALTAFSCALCGTACLGSARLVSSAGEYLMGPPAKKNDWERTLASHFVGGWIGGGLIGGLYTGKPARGVIFFAPLTLLFGLGEVLFQDLRQERLERIQQEMQEAQEQ